MDQLPRDVERIVWSFIKPCPSHMELLIELRYWWDARAKWRQYVARHGPASMTFIDVQAVWLSDSEDEVIVPYEPVPDVQSGAELQLYDEAR